MHSNTESFYIAEWMNDKNYKLKDCYQNPEDKGFKNQEEFLKQLSKMSHKIKHLAFDKWNDISVSRCIKGLVGMNIKLQPVQLIMKELAAKMQRLHDAEVIFSAESIANAFYGLQGMPEASAEVKALIEALTHTMKASSERFEAKHISMSLCGLQSMTAFSTEVKALIEVLTHKVNASDAVFDQQAIRFSLNGLQNMYVNPEVKSLVQALTKKILETSVVLNAVDIGQSLFGLKKMSSQSMEVKGLLAALTQKVRQSNDSFDGQTIGYALYGLQSMSADSQELRALLAALTKKIHASPDVFNNHAIGSTLYGLKNMSADSQEVRDLLKVLTEKISLSQANLDEQTLGNALYGLQNMSADSQELRDLLVVITQKINLSTHGVNKQAIGNALYGLRLMNSESSPVQNLLKALTQKVNQLNEPLGPQELGNSLYGLHGMNLDSEEVITLLNALEKKTPQQILSYTAEPMAWAQIVSSAYELAERSQKKCIRLPVILEKNPILSALELKTLFLETLGEHYQDDVIDLHNLNHISATLLLNFLFSSPSNHPWKQIIFGRGLHSKLQDSNKMRDLVSSFLNRIQMTGDIEMKGGAISNLRSLVNSIEPQPETVIEDGWELKKPKKSPYLCHSLYQIPDETASECKYSAKANN